MSHDVECPYCKAGVYDLWEYSELQKDGASVDHECEECEKKFCITMSIQVSYAAKKRIEDCDHKESYSKVYCDVCDGLLVKPVEEGGV